jgi:hypothetical protein
VFLIMFKTGQALPLVFTRILRPRSSRGEGAGEPREVCRSWPRTRQIHGPDSARNRMWTQTVRVHGQSVSAFRPRPQSRPQTIRIVDYAPASTVRKPAVAADLHCPQTVRSLERSTSAHSSCPRTVREPRLAENYHRRRIVVSISPPINSPVCIQLIPAYVLI